jgi:hypothetical protein
MWAGDRCENYEGECDDRCEGCNGPSSQECDFCVANTTVGLVEAYGRVCECDEGWSGIGCLLWSDKCFSTCLGCYGPGREHCILCRPNADRDRVAENNRTDGQCYCLRDWSLAMD